MNKNVLELSKEEILRLLALHRGMRIGDPADKTHEDEVLVSLKEKGYIDSTAIGYSFMEDKEGQNATKEFVDKYSKIIKELTERYGESVKTHLKIVEQTGLPDIVVEKLASYQGIRLIP